MNNVKERRRYIRTEVPVPVIIGTKQENMIEELQAQTKNISATGLMVEIGKRLPLGDVS